VRFDKVALVGVGLLGGSLGMALRARRMAAHVAGLVRRDASIRECIERGAVDSASTSMADVVSDADVVVLCTPVGDMPAMARAIASCLAPRAVITDVGSVKGSVMREVAPLLPQGRFVGSHPMAGSEQAGVGAARADLFDGARCAVTPSAESLPGVTDSVEGLWRGVGAEVMRMSPELHDAWVARASHLPHVLASVLAHDVLDPSRDADVRRLCATGFRDTTRIASGHPGMWRDILLSNRAAILEALAEWRDELAGLERLIAAGDAEGTERFLAEARHRREAWTHSPRGPHADSTSSATHA
jgi:prephenate dehydrogenase